MNLLDLPLAVRAGAWPMNNTFFESASLRDIMA
jgi:hypothetical protein